MIVFSISTFLSELIINLPDNAIKYSPKEKNIIIKIVHKQEQTTLIIKDEGYGIPKKDIEYIFNRSFRGENSSYTKNGLGIGLNIVKKIAILLKLKIFISSYINIGTEFSIIFPK